VRCTVFFVIEIVSRKVYFAPIKILESFGIKPVKLLARSPDLNCYAERFVKSVKSECLDHLILSSVKQLEYAIKQYCEYYHHERIRQSFSRIIKPKHNVDNNA